MTANEIERRYRFVIGKSNNDFMMRSEVSCGKNVFDLFSIISIAKSTAFRPI